MALLFLAALAGAIGGLVFWLIRRPDRDHPGTSSVSAERAPDPPIEKKDE